MPDMLPYTHYSYFVYKKAAESCAGDLADYRTMIKPSALSRREWKWLLLAGNDADLDSPEEDWNRGGEVAEIVERHGGYYDGGEVSYLPVPDGLVPIEEPALTVQDYSATENGVLLITPYLESGVLDLIIRYGPELGIWESTVPCIPEWKIEIDEALASSGWKRCEDWKGITDRMPRSYVVERLRKAGNESV